MSAHPLDKVLTADEFRAFIAPEVDVEAMFTEEMNEDRTLADYLSDLQTRISRLLVRDDDLWESI